MNLRSSFAHYPLQQQQQLVVFGAAVVDLVADIAHLPTTGEDVALANPKIHVGGCALNIAIALRRLGLLATNAIPIGVGQWAETIRQRLAAESIVSSLSKNNGDNGWCLALVDPQGERTFLSVSGVEETVMAEDLAKIDVDHQAIIYICGYQLIGRAAEHILRWLTAQPSTVQILVDFGPNIAEIAPHVIAQLLTLNTIVTLNRQEAHYVQTHWLRQNTPSLDIETIKHYWFQQYKNALIIRVDKEGAYCCAADSLTFVPAVPTTVVDTIGAGDSHCAGVLAGLASGWPMVDAVRFGNAVAAYVVAHKGGDCAPNQATLEHYLKHINQ